MPIRRDDVLKQIDVAIEKYDEVAALLSKSDCSDAENAKRKEAFAIIAATIERLTVQGSIYRKSGELVYAKYGLAACNRSSFNTLVGILRALRHDYEAGHLQAIHELIHADVFSDFLEMADYFLQKGYKDPSAVIVGGVFEEHLRKLCEKNGIEIMNDDRPKMIGNLNADLYRANIYGKIEHTTIKGWLSIRNSAAHGKYAEYTKEQVAQMLQSVRDFITRHPA